MTRLVLAAVALLTALAVPSLAAPTGITAYCTIESTYVSAAGHTVRTPAVTVPC